MQNIAQNKNVLMHLQYKMENNEFKKARTKNLTCYYFDDIIKLEDFYFDNILIDQKFHQNVFIYNVS